jgi:hypothetical protein
VTQVVTKTIVQKCTCAKKVVKKAKKVAKKKAKKKIKVKGVQKKFTPRVLPHTR